MNEFLKKYSSLLIAAVVFITLSAIAFIIYKGESYELTWLLGTITFISIWPVEAALFTFLKPTFLVNLAGALILGSFLMLANYLQTSTLTWSIIISPACILWPIGFIVWDIIKRFTKSNLLASFVGWFVVSAIAIIAEWAFTKKLTWSLPLVVILAFWPVASIAFIAVDEKSVDNPEPKETFLDVQEKQEPEKNNE